MTRIRRSNLILIVIALLLSTVTTLLVMKTLNQWKAAGAKVQTTGVVVVLRSLPAHQVVQSADVAIEQVDAKSVELGAITSLAQVVGSYTSGQWFAGQQVIAPMVVSTPAAAAFPLQIPKGKRAITIADDPLTGVDHLISPGDHVDVLVVYSDKLNHGPEAVTLIQDVDVLNVDHAPGNGASGGMAGGTGNTGSSADTVTLALTLKQAEKLDYAASFGQIKLVLRNPMDARSIAIAPARP